MFKSEKGVSAVEFALIAPLLFVITFGIIEFGILLFDKAVVTNASREGARKAILYNTDVDGNYEPIPEEDGIEVVNNYTSNHLISLGSTAVPAIEVNCYEHNDYSSEIDPCVTQGDVKVIVTYTYDFLVFPNLLSLLGSSFAGTMDLVGTTLMRME